MYSSLLTSLRKYVPRENHDPLENFITEAFAWLLINNKNFSNYFLREISKTIKSKTTNLDLFDQADCRWNTQVNFDGKFPDMVCTSRENIIIFEHKTWSNLHKNQLKNYKDYAKDNYKNHWVVLITATRKQHIQNPDIELCWNDVYEIVNNWSNEHIDASFIFDDFLTLIKSEGMGPPAPISHEAIQYYFDSIDLEKNISELIKRVDSKDWIENFNSRIQIEDLNKWTHDKRGSIYGLGWGRIGINFLSWSPGIFVGILLDGRDHYTKPMNKDKGPDFCLILSFERKYHNKYPKEKDYIKLINELTRKVRDIDSGWQIYKHLEDDETSKKNKWHPIHIRKPMLDVFNSSTTTNEQEEIFYLQASKLINAVTSIESFWSLRKVCE